MVLVPRGLAALESIERLAIAHREVDELVRIDGLPIHAFHFGAREPNLSVLLITAGVHGLERIGTDVAIAYLTTLVARSRWDRVLHDALARCRIIVVPLVNPVGMSLGRRANGNGVDLMRNAPDVGFGGTPLLGGQRISPRLPYYMGPRGSAMQPEAAAVVKLVETEVHASPFCIAIDLHSGYGFLDRLWYPYARTREPLPDQPGIDKLHRLLDDTLPNHVYRVEQTAQAYTIRGDLWDHLYDRRREAGGGMMLPLTLEMGSWAWVRKNPLQGLSSIGRFNPVEPHRVRRTLRRHVPLLDFLHHAAASYPSWS